MVFDGIVAIHSVVSVIVVKKVPDSTPHAGRGRLLVTFVAGPKAFRVDDFGQCPGW
jgi:hypothetical protein